MPPPHLKLNHFGNWNLPYLFVEPVCAASRGHLFFHCASLDFWLSSREPLPRPLSSSFSPQIYLSSSLCFYFCLFCLFYLFFHLYLWIWTGSVFYDLDYNCGLINGYSIPVAISAAISGDVAFLVANIASSVRLAASLIMILNHLLFKWTCAFRGIEVL